MTSKAKENNVEQYIEQAIQLISPMRSSKSEFNLIGDERTMLVSFVNSMMANYNFREVFI